MLIFCRCSRRACGFSTPVLYLLQKRRPPAASQEGGVFHLFTAAESFARLPQGGTCTAALYFAVLIKLRLSHRYFAPEISVTAATSQHRPMLISETAPMASAGAKAAST